MNLNSGKFTAPVAGRYFFSFTELVRFPGSSALQYCQLYLYKNGNLTAQGDSDEISTLGQYKNLSFQSTLNLVKGDEIWLEINSLTTGTYLHGYLFNHFNGFLLEEDVYESVKTLQRDYSKIC